MKRGVGKNSEGVKKNFLLLIVGIIFVLCFVGGVSAAILDVGAGQDYSTIQLAVNAAQTGDTIFIHNGVYHETISTSKISLKFEGESKEGVIWTSMHEAIGNPSWTKTSGYNNVYQADASTVASSTVQGIVDEDFAGVYREKISLDDVDDLPGTHFTTGGLIYVHTSDGASPGEHTLWYTTNNYANILYLSGGSYEIRNISFIGATQYGVWIRATSSNMGENTISNCLFRSIASPDAIGGAGVVVATSDSVVGGILNIFDSEILYCVSPTYDSSYSIFMDAQGNNHAYQGFGVDTQYLSEVNIEDSVFRYMRGATSDTGTANYNLRRNKVTDIAVHTHMHNMASYAVMIVENSIYSMYGSTLGPRDVGSSQGFKIYLLNNVVYAGENPVIGERDVGWFSASDSHPVNIPSDVYIYNNIFIRDQDASSNNAIPLTLDGVSLDAIHMNNNFYTRGRVDGTDPNENYVRGQPVGTNTAYTLGGWQTYTSGLGSSKDQNSIYEAIPNNAGLAVLDYQDTGNPDLGKILSDSFAIDNADANFAPLYDFIGVLRPQGGGYDIGAYEYISGSDTLPPIRSGGSPSGTLPSGTTQDTIALNVTDASGVSGCRYSTTAGTAYASMTNTLTNSGGDTYSATVSGLTDGGSYNYYVRCIDTLGNENTNDFTISFSVASASACGGADSSPVDGVVSISELLNYISAWKFGSVTISDLLTGIGEWKNGC